MGRSIVALVRIDTFCMEIRVIMTALAAATADDQVTKVLEARSKQRLGGNHVGVVIGLFETALANNVSKRVAT